MAKTKGTQYGLLMSEKHHNFVPNKAKEVREFVLESESRKVEMWFLIPSNIFFLFSHFFHSFHC